MTHSFHAGELGLTAAIATIRLTSHAKHSIRQRLHVMPQNVKGDSPLLEPIRTSYYGEDANRDGKLAPDEDSNGDGILNRPSVPWVRVHKTPDYAYF